MHRSFKALSLLFALALTPAAMPVGAFAQQQEAPLPAKEQAAPAPAPEMTRQAKALIEDVLRKARLVEFYNDFRRTLADVYIPVLKDITEGGYPGVPAPDAKTAAKLAQLLTFLANVNKAGDELERHLLESREAMIGDAAELIAKHAAPAELEDLTRLLNQPATQKAFEVFYSATKLLTSFNYDETRTLAEYQALIESWVDKLEVDPSQLFPGVPGTARGTPSARKMEKAQALFTDFIAATRIEAMVADGKRFARDVYAELAPRSPEEKQAIVDQIEQFEFTYALQKAVIMAAAPPLLASVLTDEQIATLHTFVRTPVYEKLFTIVHDVVRKSASFTADEIKSTQSLMDDIEKRAKERARTPEDQKRFDDEAQALVDKWGEQLSARLSPDTREALTSSLAALQSDFSSQ